MSAAELRFTVPGPPVPCARARVVVRPGRRAHAFTPAATEEYEHRVALVARVAAAAQRWRFVESDRFELEMTFHLANDRGDWDNYAKGVADGMTASGVVWRDDSHVKAARVLVFVDRMAPRAEVVVRKLEWRAPPPMKRTRTSRLIAPATLHASP